VHGNYLRNRVYAKTLLPREQGYGSRFFSDIQTCLIAKGKFRASITGYDREYKETKNGHPTGGALSLLWHENTGILLAASMNQYQLFEAGNMQADTDPLSMPLTPRLECAVGQDVYMNIADLSATIEEAQNQNTITITTQSKLVNKNQESPEGADIHCKVSYTFSEKQTVLSFQHDAKMHRPRVIIPLVAKSTEQVKVVSSSVIEIKKDRATVRISGNTDLVQLPTSNGRIFNFVPGLEAIPLVLEHNNAVVTIEVIA